jgi:hypothetical protein
MKFDIGGLFLSKVSIASGLLIFRQILLTLDPLGQHFLLFIHELWLVRFGDLNGLDDASGVHDCCSWVRPCDGGVEDDHNEEWKNDTEAISVGTPLLLRPGCLGCLRHAFWKHFAACTQYTVIVRSDCTIRDYTQYHHHNIPARITLFLANLLFCTPLPRKRRCFTLSNYHATPSNRCHPAACYTCCTFTRLGELDIKFI